MVRQIAKKQTNKRKPPLCIYLFKDKDNGLLYMSMVYKETSGEWGLF